ncbi:MAG: hypothetical protein WCR59_12925 [Planctomycetota bacterium]|jgi:hypothetical protein|nr:hypothetical protein [Planctomycetota bacterium]
MTKSVLALILAAFASLGFVKQGQEPNKLRPAPAPAGAARLPLLEEPVLSPVPRLDLPMRFQPRDPLEGFWELRARAVAGAPAIPGRGMIAIGRNHMMVQFEGPGLDAATSLLRAGAYSWQRTGEQDMVRMTVEVSHFNDNNGAMHVEEKGATQLRRCQLMSDILRVHQGNNNWLDFMRIE